MVRDLDRLTARTFDLLVVGGGIYGLTVAYDAAQRGLSVALVERDDFGGGASFNHLRTLHGGLRHLQRLDVRRARESVTERAVFARIAPHMIRPLPFVLPLSRSLLAGRTAMRAGFLLDRLIGFDRNRGVPAPLRLPAGHLMSRDEAARRFPGLPRRGLTGAAVWYDYAAAEADRLTFSFALAADQHGAVLANHVEARSLLIDGTRVAGIRAHDRLCGRDLEISAQLTINATGAALDHLLAPAGIAIGSPFVKAMNLVTRKAGGGEAIGGRGPSGRAFFLVPWRGRLLAGTWESTQAATLDGSGVTESEVASFVEELNQVFPTLDLQRTDVTLVHRGIVPAVVDPKRGMSLEGEARFRNHGEMGIRGLLSVAGAKYTTARLVAATIVDRVLVVLNRSPAPCRTATTPLPGATGRDVATAVDEARRSGAAGLPSDILTHLVAAYGSGYRDILHYGIERPEWLHRLDERSPVVGAQLVQAVRREMAATLADAVIRRTPLGALECPSEAALASAAAVVGAELGWSDERRRDEIETVRRFYTIGA
jgi:glycerol-3-phosphate dehydrogenase